MRQIASINSGSLRVTVSAEKKVGIAHIAPVAAWMDPTSDDPFGPDSYAAQLLSGYRTIAVDVTDTSALDGDDLVRAIRQLRAGVDANIVIAGVPWRDKFVDAGFPVFPTAGQTVDYFGRRRAPAKRRTKPTTRRRPKAPAQEPIERRVKKTLRVWELLLIQIVMFVGTANFMGHYAYHIFRPEPAAVSAPRMEQVQPAEVAPTAKIIRL